MNFAPPNAPVIIMPGQTAPSSLLSQHRVRVSDIGTTVRLEFGNAHVDMPYELAIQLSAWLRLHGKRAKANAGDFSRTWRAIGMLDGMQ